MSTCSILFSVFYQFSETPIRAFTANFCNFQSTQFRVMPTNDEEYHRLHHRHHDDIFNPNPRSYTNPSRIPTAATHYPPQPKPNQNFLSLVLKAIIMILITSLFFLFLGIAAVAVIHFFLAGGVLHRLHLRRRSTATVHETDSASFSTEDIQRNLPRLRYAAGSTGKDCAVCLESFKEGEWCRSLPRCRHMFHAGCLDRWLTKVANCPVCRSPVCLISEAASSVIGDDCKLLWAVGV